MRRGICRPQKPKIRKLLKNIGVPSRMNGNGRKTDPKPQIYVYMDKGFDRARPLFL